MKLRHKSQMVVLIGLIGLFLMLVNFFLSKHFTRLDLTEDQEYTLSDATKKILGQLKDRVTIKLYFTSEVPSYLNPLIFQINDLLTEYQIYSDKKIVVERVVPEESAQKEQEARLLGIPPLQLSVIERDKREVRKVYLGMGIFYADTKEVIPVVADASHLEYELTSSIIKLTREKIPNVGLILPEGSYQGIEQILERQIKLEKLTLDDKFEGRDLQALLILGPKNASPDFTKELDAALARGVSVVLMAGRVDVSPDLTASTLETGLEDWLKGRGIQISPEVLVDRTNPGRAVFHDGFMQYNIPYPFFVRVAKTGLNAESAVTAKLEEVVFPWTNVLELHPELHPDWKYTTLAKSSQASFLQEGAPDISPQVFETMEMKSGETHPIAELVEMEGQGRLVVVANSRFLEDNFLKDYDSNVLFLQNLVDWLSVGDELIGIRSRGKTDRPLLNPGPETISLIRWTHIIGIPLMVIGFGLGLAFLRRRRYRRLQEIYG